MDERTTETVEAVCGAMKVGADYARQRDGLPTYAELEEKVAELQAIVDKLPRTADGVPVVPGMVLHYRRGWQVLGAMVGEYADREGDWHCVAIDDCYSTRQAAEAAKGKTE